MASRTSQEIELKMFILHVRLDLVRLPRRSRSGGGGAPLAGPLESILAIVVVLHGLLDLGARVHDEGPMLHHGLTKRLPGDEHEPERPVRPIPHAEPVAGSKHEAVVRGGGRGLVPPEHALAVDDVDEGVPPFGHRLVEA